MITEDTIERILNDLESGNNRLEEEFQDFAEDQPFLMSYLTHEETEAFTESERELLLFGALVIYRSVHDQQILPSNINSQKISSAEEANYALLPTEKSTFRDRLTPFFDASDQEDLLAFIEDMLVAESEDDTVTREGREPLFITLKTVVDVLTNHQ